MAMKEVTHSYDTSYPLESQVIIRRLLRNTDNWTCCLSFLPNTHNIIHLLLTFWPKSLKYFSILPIYNQLRSEEHTIWIRIISTWDSQFHLLKQNSGTLEFAVSKVDRFLSIDMLRGFAVLDRMRANRISHSCT